MLKFQNRALIFSAIWLEILGLVPAANKTTLIIRLGQF
jgi:hypothetical protein